MTTLKEFFTLPEKWCRGTCCRDADGYDLGTAVHHTPDVHTDPRAVAFDIPTALELCYPVHAAYEAALQKVVSWVKKNCRMLNWKGRSDIAGLILWNDKWAEWEDVVAMLKETGV